MDQTATFVLNDKCGGRPVDDVRALIERVAAALGVAARIHVACQKGDLETFAAQGCREGRVVAAGGGDGTISTVAAALVGSDVALGVLPLGTLNHFAKDNRIPLDLEAAIRAVLAGAERRIDVAEVNGHVFLNNSSIGVYPEIVREREEYQRRGDSKWVAFAQAAAHTLRKGVTLHIDLADASGAVLPRDTPMLFVGNNRYAMTGLSIGTRAALDEGKLFVCAAPAAGHLKLFGLAVAALAGWASSAEFTTFDTGAVTVRTRRRRIDVATDGEVTTMETPLRYRIRPAALRLRVPG